MDCAPVDCEFGGVSCSSGGVASGCMSRCSVGVACDSGGVAKTEEDVASATLDFVTTLVGFGCEGSWKLLDTSECKSAD